MPFRRPEGAKTYQPRAKRSAALGHRPTTTQGITAIEKTGVLKVQPFDEFGTPTEILRIFGGRDQYLDALRDLEKALYEAA